MKKEKDTNIISVLFFLNEKLYPNIFNTLYHMIDYDNNYS